MLKDSSRMRDKVPQWTQIDEEVRSFCTRIAGTIAELGLREDEAHAIVLYTYGFIDKAEGNFYFEENADLRRLAGTSIFERCDVIEAWQPHITWMLAGMDRLPSFDGRVFRARPMKAAELETYCVGQSVTFAAFTSTSKSEAVAAQLAASWEDGVILRITCFAGKCVSPLSFFPNEDEILLEPGLSFVVCGAPYMKDADALSLTLDLLQLRGQPLRS